MSALEKRWCLVLGVSSGMGRAGALALGREGANVLGVHFDTATGQAAAEEVRAELLSYGVRARFVNANAASAATRAEVVELARELTGAGGIRVLLHSLAFGSLAPYLGSDGVAAITPKQVEMTLNVMAHSLVYWAQDLYVAGLIGAGSKIFAMTSAGSTRVSPNCGAVSAAKCALEAHVRQLAVELAPAGVAVNSLRAGVTLTPSFERIPESAQLKERVLRTNPHGRLTTPEDVADAVLTLSRSESSWLTGNVIGVDGGEVLTG